MAGPDRIRPLVSLALCCLGACAPAGREVREIEGGARTVAAADLDVRWNASMQQRFQLSMPGAAPRGEAHAAPRLTWKAPEGWQPGGERAMRVVTFLLGEEGEAECYVTLLGGTGGGLEANLTRWSEQVGAAPLSSEEVARLERIPMLGGDGVLFEAAGHFTGMGGEEVSDALLLGAVRMLPTSAIFVKMIGPRAVCEPEREAFREFCKSLEQR